MSESSSVYNELRLEKQLCDAVIRVDNAEFHVHKVVMCNCSTYFRAFFTHWPSPDSRLFEIPDVSAEMMNLIVEFAYTGFVPVTQENLQELFITADRFKVMGIIKACSDVLEENLTPQNCISIWRFTDFYSYAEIKNKAFLFLLNHFEAVAATSEEFLLLSRQEFAKIIENDQLIVKKEKTVFEAIIRWITYSTEERSKYISQLFSKVRYAFMTEKDIVESVNDDEVVKSSEQWPPHFIRAVLDIRTKYFSNSSFCHPLARPRLPAAVLLAVGGWNTSSPTIGIDTYDVRANCWVNITDNEAAARAYHGTAFLNGSVYCVGGIDDVRRLGLDNVQFSTVDRFDLGTHTWQEVAPMHLGRLEVSVTVLDGYIYAMGGYDGHVCLSTAERYEPRTNQWTLIASMNERRCRACCTTLSGKIYICGGTNGNEFLSTAESYTPGTNQWTMIAAMGNRRGGLGVVAYAGYVFAVGGFDGSRDLQSVEAYNPDTNTWSDMPSMLNRRREFGIAVIDDRIFVAGGLSDLTTIRDVECYSIEADEWAPVTDMKISRIGLSCCVVYGLDNLAEYAAPRPSLQFSEKGDHEMVQ